MRGIEEKKKRWKRRREVYDHPDSLSFVTLHEIEKENT